MFGHLGIEQKLFDHKKGVYIHPMTGDEINIGDAVKRGYIQVQAVSSQIVDERSSSGTRSNVSIHIESQPQSSRPSSQLLKREKEIIEIESIQRAPRHRRHHHTTTEEEIIEENTTNIVDKEVYIVRGRSSERPRQKQIEEVIIDEDRNKNQRRTIDIKEDNKYIHEEIHIETDKHKPQPPKDKYIPNGSHREHEVNHTYCFVRNL
jgi:hypothetical protein